MIPRWLEIASTLDKENIKFFNSNIYSESKLISNNGISMVFRHSKMGIFKMSIPFLIENEIYFLGLSGLEGAVPESERFDKYTIRMQDLGKSEPITNFERARDSADRVLWRLEISKVKHGDLSEPNIIVKNNHIYVLDFAESRNITDPRPDKKGRDSVLLYETIKRLNGK